MRHYSRLLTSPCREAGLPLHAGSTGTGEGVWGNQKRGSKSPHILPVLSQDTLWITQAAGEIISIRRSPMCIAPPLRVQTAAENHNSAGWWSSTQQQVCRTNMVNSPPLWHKHRNTLFFTYWAAAAVFTSLSHSCFPSLQVLKCTNPPPPLTADSFSMFLFLRLLHQPPFQPDNTNSGDFQDCSLKTVISEKTEMQERLQMFRLQTFRTIDILKAKHEFNCDLPPSHNWRGTFNINKCSLQSWRTGILSSAYDFKSRCIITDSSYEHFLPKEMKHLLLQFSAFQLL